MALFLQEQQVVADAASVELEPLPGGVSFEVVAAHAPEGEFVVKRSLPKLRVAVDWPAKIERVFTEVAAMRLQRPWTPEHVPAVRAFDPARFMYAMDRAPTSWAPWKQRLMAGKAEPRVAASLGSILGEWHARTWADGAVAEAFDDHEAFDQLRLDPYYRYTATVRPDLAEPLNHYLIAQAERRSCLVHGDYSPKNVLVGDDGLWVLDYEVSHFGDPVFDLAFMLNHLAIKTIHMPTAAADLEASAVAFLAAYTDRLGQPTDESYLSGQIGCLMLARVHGKSPVDYLDAQGQATADRVATSLLRDPTDSIDALWRRLRT
jgi:aminoglycoside phosphotransferase (APT) family kinase protein